MSFNPLAKSQGLFAAKVEAAERLRKEANATALTKMDQMAEAAKEFTFSIPELATEALGIVFDNSGSMAGQAIIDAREGTEELMKACTPNETAIKIIPLNNGNMSHTNIQTRFSCDLPLLALDLPFIKAEGGTPLFEVIQANLEPDPLNPKVKLSRMIVFSDGEPNGSYTFETGGCSGYDQTIKTAKEKNVILDTVLIVDYPSAATEDNRAYKIMKGLAEGTGGYFMVFERGKSFVRGLKYLEKGKRKLLADPSFKKELEAGHVG